MSKEKGKSSVRAASSNIFLLSCRVFLSDFLLSAFLLFCLSFFLGLFLPPVLLFSSLRSVVCFNDTEVPGIPACLISDLCAVCMWRVVILQSARHQFRISYFWPDRNYYHI